MTDGLPADLARTVDDLFAAFPDGRGDRPNAPGIAYGVVIDGQLVHAGGHGTAVVGEDRRPGPDTVFRIASMTKSFVAAAVLLLRDRGLLALDDPLQRHVPEASGIAAGGDAAPITLRQLLTMASGLPQDDPEADRLESIGDAELTAILASAKTFAWRPGVAFEYANLGYAALGRVVANVAGVSFQRFIEDELIAPCGLTATWWNVDDVEPATFAQGYHWRDGVWELQPIQPTGAFASIGGLSSSVRDLATWIGGYCDAWQPRPGADVSHPLAPATRRAQQVAATALPLQLRRDHRGRLQAVATGYCLGLVSEDDLGIGRVVSHSGGYPGYGTHMRWHPATGIGVVSLANGRYAPAFAPGAEALGQVVEALTHRRRAPRPGPAFASARDLVDRMLERVDDDVVAAFAPNVDQDEPIALRRAELERLAAVHGSLCRDGDVTVVTPLRGSWWLAGERGRVEVYVALTAEVPPRVHEITFTSVVEPARALVDAVAAVVAAANGAAGLDAIACTNASVRHELDAIVRELAVYLAPCVLEGPSAGEGGATAAFVIRGRSAAATLELEHDLASGAISSVRLDPIDRPADLG